MEIGADEEISKEISHFLYSTRGNGCFTLMPHGDDAFIYHLCPGFVLTKEARSFELDFAPYKTVYTFYSSWMNLYSIFGHKHRTRVYLSSLARLFGTFILKFRAMAFVCHVTSEGLYRLKELINVVL